MKKTISSLLLSTLVIISLSSCSLNSDTTPLDIYESVEESVILEDVHRQKSETEIDGSQTVFQIAEMPEPFTGFGGDENRDFNQRYNIKMYTSSVILEEFINYLGITEDEALEKINETWEGDFWSSLNKSSLLDTKNIYSYMILFDIPDEVLIDAINKNNQHYTDVISATNDTTFQEVIFTEADINALISRDEKIVTAQFANSTAIVIDDKAYSPAWLYLSTANDYVNAGITPEMIEAKLDAYSQFYLADDAVNAFEEKLSEFTSSDIIFDDVSDEDIDTASIIPESETADLSITEDTFEVESAPQEFLDADVSEIEAESSIIAADETPITEVFEEILGEDAGANVDLS